MTEENKSEKGYTIVRTGNHNGRLEETLSNTGIKFIELTKESKSTYFAYDIDRGYIIIASGYAEDSKVKEKYLRGHNTLVAIASTDETQTHELARILAEKTGITLENHVHQSISNFTRAQAESLLPTFMQDPEAFFKAHGVNRS